MDDKKKKGLAAIIIAAGKPKVEKKEAEEAEESEEVDESGLDAAAEEVLAAIKSEDAEALKEALKDFVDICCNYHDEE